MLALKEFIRRSLNGPIVSEQDFDVKLSRSVRQLVSKYSIALKPPEIICDDATADAIFQASVDLLSQAGLYNWDTSRVILLSRDEVIDAAGATPKESPLGGEEDTVWLRGRTHDSGRAPQIVCWLVRNTRQRGGIEETFIDTTTAHAAERTGMGRLARSLLEELEGIENLADTPGELMWSRAIARWRRAIADTLGTPNMYWGLGSGVSIPAITAAYGEGLQNRFNSCIPISLMPELKLNWNLLKLAYLAQEMQVHPWTSAAGVLGIFCGKGEEMAVINVANMMGQLCYGHGAEANMGLMDRNGHRTTRAVTQAHSAACRAMERNVGNPVGATTPLKNGVGTAKSIYELAAGTVSQTCSGVAWIWGFPCHPGKEGDPEVDLDCMLAARISRGVAGMGREEANELLARLLALYEPTYDLREEGKPYTYYYDMRTLTPNQELKDLYQREEDLLARLGVPLADSPRPWVS